MDAEGAAEAWSDLQRPDAVVVANVRGSEFEEKISRWCFRHWGLTVNFLRPQATAYGVTNAYRDPAQLGSDRWAALIGVRSLTERDVVVVDCGTALTIDVMDNRGCFVGGVILPGMSLMRHALAQRAPGIGTVEATDEGALGISTGGGIGSGLHYGLAGAVERVLREAKRQLGAEPALYLTGGDAASLQKFLENPWVLAPDLVLTGLSVVFGQT